MTTPQVNDRDARRWSPLLASSAKCTCSSPVTIVGSVAEAAAKIAGVGKVHVADDAAYAQRRLLKTSRLCSPQS